MASQFGDFLRGNYGTLGKMYNNYKGTDKNGNPTAAGMRAQAFGTMLDYYQSSKEARKAEEEARKQLAIQQRLNEQYAQLAARRAEEESQIRESIVQRTAMMNNALAQAQAAMGPRYFAKPEDIQQNYDQIRDVMYRNVDRAQANESSTGFSDAITRGMDRSKAFRKEQDARVAKYADLYNQADQEAYNAAIGRVGAYGDTLNAGRQANLDEIKSLYNPGLTALQNTMPTTGGTMLDNAYTNQSSLRSLADTSASNANQVAGRQMGTIDDTFSRNLGYMLGRTPNYTPTKNDEVESLKKQIADLQRRNNALTGSNT